MLPEHGQRLGNIIVCGKLPERAEKLSLDFRRQRFAAFIKNIFQDHRCQFAEILILIHDAGYCRGVQQLGEPVTAFCYPYAFPRGAKTFVAAFRDLLVDAGYACCATTVLGRVCAGDDPFSLKRLPANSLDDLALFQAKLDGNYDWLAGPQALFKKLTSRNRIKDGVACSDCQGRELSN